MQALTQHLDINAAPRRAMLVALAELAESSEDRERLKKLASKTAQDKVIQGRGHTHTGHSDEYHDYITKGMRTVLF